MLTLVAARQAHALDLGGAPGAVNLMTLSGERITMNNYQERPATAVLFLSSRCEATEHAIDDINGLYTKYRLRNLLFVGISSNPAETGEELRAFAQGRGVIFPIYRDPGGGVARQFSARATPELFLLDGRGALVFHGGLEEADGRHAFDKALESIERKQPIGVATHPTAGTPIDRPGPKRAIDDSYGSVSFASELVFDKIPQAAAHHCSTICEAANKDLLCLWYGGSYESADDQALYLARRKRGEKNWSVPRMLLQNAVQPPGNGVIFRDGDRLWIVWARMEGTRPMRRGSGWDRCRLMTRISGDHGETWSEDRPMFDEALWCVPRNPPVALASGLLLGVEGRLDEVEGSHFLMLASGESSWRRAGFTSGGSQPAVVRRGDDSLLALLRHSRNITQVESRDNGQTWTTAQPTTLKNPDAGISMTRLANGHLVLVFNDSQSSRTPLSIVRSLNDGRTWEQPLHLESNPGEYSYPCIIQASDQRIHVTYTYRRYAIKHVELNEDWLVYLRRPN